MAKFRMITSITKLLVYHVDERLAAAEALEILQEELHAAPLPVWRVVGAVRREKHVVQFIKRMGGGQRVGIIDIESRAENAFTFERVDEGVLVDYRSAADVDEYRGWLHDREFRRADQPA